METSDEFVDPGPDCLYPLKNVDGSSSRQHVFLKNVVTNPNVTVGDFTFYHDFVDPCHFEARNAGYFPAEHAGKLTIGKYCSIAHGAQFLSSVSNHHMDGFSTFPFPAFWGEAAGYEYYYPDKGDTYIGHNVWIGCEATIMPGVTVGDGAIVGTRAVVTRDVAPFTIVAGNPAREVRRRFSPEVTKRLLEIRWWDWPHAAVVEHAPTIVGSDLAKLEAVAKRVG